jgi:hypothetical protein
MKALFATILALTSLSAFSYSFALPDNSQFQNKACSLTVGSKILTRRGSEILYKQDALLRIGNEKIDFTINDMKNSTNAYILGTKFIDDGKLIIQAKQLSATKIKIVGVMVEPTETERMVFDCGVLNF